VSETPLKQVGPSAKHGAGTWKAERWTSLLLVPLALWGLWSVGDIAGAGYEGAVAWLRQPVNAALLLVTLAISAWHAVLGLHVVIEDYLHGGFGVFLLRLTTLMGWLLFAVAAGAVAVVFFGLGFGV